MNKIIVSLTSYGKRLESDGLKRSINSVIDCEQVENVYLWAEGDCNIRHPKLAIFDISEFKRLKSYNKLAHIGDHARDKRVLVIDDDTVYNPHFIDIMCAASDFYPDNIICTERQQISRDFVPTQFIRLKDREFDLRNWIPMTGRGVLYPPGFFDDVHSYVEENAKCAPYHDDLFWWKEAIFRGHIMAVQVHSAYQGSLDLSLREQDTLWNYNKVDNRQKEQFDALMECETGFFKLKESEGWKAIVNKLKNYCKHNDINDISEYTIDIQRGLKLFIEDRKILR